ncbi:hypothetical protein ACHQM5_029619 [Ranunculus cassubicifolius]
MMKNSPVFLKAEPVEYTGNGFDPKKDFSQFLEEARKNRANVAHPQASLQHQTEEPKMSSEVKKSKRSWRKSLFSWLKVDRKSKTSREASTSTHITNLRPGSLSGPIYGSGRKIVPSHQLRRPASGPIANLFIPSRGEELELPYMCLDPLDHPTVSQQAYGPVYLVT